MDVDLPDLPAAPSRKHKRDSDEGAKVEVVVDKSPARHRDKLKIKSPTSKSSKSEAASSSLTSPTSKTSTKHKQAPKEESSEDSEEAFERLRAMDANQPVKVPVRVETASESDDDDAPVAKSFKSVKQDAISAHHDEQEDARRAAQKEKEKRRQRAQLLQEQSKMSSSKRKEKEKRRVEEAKEQEEQEEDVLPAALLKQAVSQSNVSTVIDKNEEHRAEVERKKAVLAERKKRQEEKIEAKKVKVVVLSDAQGNLQLQGRKASTQAAEAFLKEHFWGSRLERMNTDMYMSERRRGPALQFNVQRSEDIAALRSKRLPATKPRGKPNHKN